MLYKEILPHPALQEHIKCFWVFENSYGDNHCERMIPDGFIDLVFHYGQKPKLVIDGNEVTKPSSFLGGHLTTPALLRFSGELKMFGIKFYPWASATLYKMPAFELNNIRIPVSEILGNWINDSLDLLQESLLKGNYLFAIQHIQSRLLDKVISKDTDQLILKHCFEKIILSAGTISVDTISSELGFSSRYIQKKFREKKGMPFQHYCRLYRLQMVLKRLKKLNTETLTGIAHGAGYYDQSHFIKDFTAFTGLTPKQFLGEEHLYISQNLETLS